jgi:hypothetical protein
LGVEYRKVKGTPRQTKGKRKMYTRTEVLYTGTMKDLVDLGKTAKAILKDKKLAHVVYAYSTKDAPFEIHLLDWQPLEFDTDEKFNTYLKLAETEAAMIYAVHAQP